MKNLETARVEFSSETKKSTTETEMKITKQVEKGKIVSNDRKVEPLDIPEEMIMTPTGATIRAGDLVLVEEGVGRVRYVGECHFKPGLWMGIELNHPLGTNDGSIEDRRYFYTNPKRGMCRSYHSLTNSLNQIQLEYRYIRTSLERSTAGWSQALREGYFENGFRMAKVH